MKIEHVAIYAKDLEALRAFYVKYFFPWLRSNNLLHTTEPAQWYATTFNTLGNRESDLTVWDNDPRIPYFGARHDLNRQH